MTDAEKAAKYDEMRQRLWTAAKGNNGLQSAVAAALIRSLKIPGPNGEDPEDA